MDWKNPIFRALDETGMPWRVTNGNGHKKIILSGHLVGVMSARKDRHDPRAMHNVVHQIKRKAKELRQ